MKKKNIFNFNHISPEISNTLYIELKNLYGYYHRLYYSHKKVYKEFIYKSHSLTIISTALVVAGTVIGSVTLNPIVLSVITGIGVIIAAFQKKKEYESKSKLAKYAFTLYEKILISLRSCLRGETYDHGVFIHEIKLFDEIISDLTTNVDKYMEKYDKKFTCE